MTQDEIIEMAKQVGLFEMTKDGYEVFYPDNLEAFAKLVAAKEREACAQICEQYSDTDSYQGGITTEFHAIMIRKRGEA